MSVTINSAKCPECGSNLPIEDGRTNVFCPYCGARIVITYDNERIYRHIDEAGVKQAETDRMVRLRELEIEEKHSEQRRSLNKVVTTIWLILSLFILIVSIFKIAFGTDHEQGFTILFSLGFPVIAGGAFLVFKYIPDRELEKELLKRGGIRFPKELADYTDKNYQDVYNSLKQIGFTNIICINMHDVLIGLFQKPGKIESISIDGDSVSTHGKIYAPDASIIIKYHDR